MYLRKNDTFIHVPFLIQFSLSSEMPSLQSMYFSEILSFLYLTHTDFEIPLQPFYSSGKQKDLLV